MKVAIIGIGLHPFGRHEGVTAADMGLLAVRAALADAGISWRDVGFAAGGSFDAQLGGRDATARPETLVNQLGLTGLPVMNVANGCATAASALFAAAAAIEAGQARVAVAFGFDKHEAGHFNAVPERSGLGRWYAEAGFMSTTQYFAMKINRYLHDHQVAQDTLALVAERAFRNGALNELAWRRKPLTAAEIQASRPLNYPLTQYMFCSPAEGAAAVVLCHADEAQRYSPKPVQVRAISIRTRRYGSFEVFAPWTAIERADSPTADASRACFEAAGISPREIQVAQVQDTDAGSELIHLAETGLCADGEQEELLKSGATEIGGRLPINTDGGLLANGEPIGASGMRQVYETALQLRGQAGRRQVPNQPRSGFTQVYGAPGLAACTLLTV
jgi:acetyl-CoA acetyltransferase